MELLDITSIRDTRFGKFAKMPKVSGPRGDQAQHRHQLHGVGVPVGAGSLISGVSRGSLPKP